jgi:Protein of unknown function (DUF3297)
MTETTVNAKPTLPDHLSISPKSPYFNEAVLAFQIGIRINGVEKTTVEEYCISEGWVRVAVGGKTKDRFGNSMLMKLKGKVEVYYVEE